jgi:hypothetical protein
MESWIIGAVVGGIAGAIAVGVAVTRANREVRAYPCPRCGRALGDKKPGPRTRTQALSGGWTCPECGCDVDRHGRERGT